MAWRILAAAAALRRAPVRPRGLQEAATPSSSALEAVRRYIPAALLDSIRGDGRQFFLAENRRVAVVFLALPLCGERDFRLMQARTRLPPEFSPLPPLRLAPLFTADPGNL